MFNMWATSLRFLFLLATSALCADTGVRVRSSPFASSVSRISWAGASSYSCQETCKRSCLTAATVDDYVVQRMDACIAGCGCGGGMDHVFSTTENGTAFYSKDGGDSWTDLRTQVPSSPSTATNSYRFTVVHVSHADPRSVALLTNTSAAWISHDAGTSWRPLTLFEPLAATTAAPAAAAPGVAARQVSSPPGAKAAAAGSTTAAPGPVAAVLAKTAAAAAALTAPAPHGPEHPILGWKWHPYQKDWALAETHIAGTPGKSLFVTTDAGATWQLVSGRVHQYHWAAVPGGDPRRLILTRLLEGGNGLSSRVGGAKSQPLEVLVTEDFMASFTMLLGKGAAEGGPQFAYIVHLHFNFVFAVAPAGGAAKPGSSPASGLELWVFSEAGNNSIGSPHPQQPGQPDDSKPKQPTRSEPYFRAVEWPVNMATPLPHQLRNLRVLYSVEHMALFFMPAVDLSLPWGHIFSFGYQASEAEAVLTHVHRPAGALGEIAWQGVSGVDGVFIANRVVLDQGQNLDKVERTFDSQATLVEDVEAAGEDDDEDGAGVEAAAKEKMRFAVRTYISMNMGLSWQPLRAPTKDVSGKPLPGCGGNDDAAKAPAMPNAAKPAAGAGLSGGATKDSVAPVTAAAGVPTMPPMTPKSASSVEKAAPAGPCYLRLERWTSSIAAPGVLIGVGSAGARLASSSVGVFVSRDAGLSWRHVLKGQHDVSIISHGDTMVAVPADSPGVVFYSSDAGHSWQPVTVRPYTTGLSLEGIFTHPSHTNGRVLMALRSDAATPDIAVAAVDFSPMLQASCRLPNDPGNAMSDFEKWSPADSLEDAHASTRPVCLQGVRTHYVRRKADKLCNTGLLQLAPLDLRKDTVCQCTIADWACAAGYQRMTYSADSPCEPLDGTKAPNVTQMCDATMDPSVQVTRGYVRIPGNRCEGGKDLSPIVEQCQSNVGIAGMLKTAMSSRGQLYMAGATAVLLLVFLAHRRISDARSQTSLKMRMYGETNTGDFDEDDIEREFLINEKDK